MLILRECIRNILNRLFVKVGFEFKVGFDLCLEVK